MKFLGFWIFTFFVQLACNHNNYIAFLQWSGSGLHNSEYFFWVALLADKKNIWVGLRSQKIFNAIQILISAYGVTLWSEKNLCPCCGYFY